MLQDDDSNEPISITVIAYTSFGIFILDLMTYILGLCLIRRLKVDLDRTLKLALVITGLAIILKTVYNVLLFSTDASPVVPIPPSH